MAQKPRIHRPLNSLANEVEGREENSESKDYQQPYAEALKRLVDV